jgi:hypothetical protein
MTNHQLGNRDQARRSMAKLPPPQDRQSESFDPEIELLRQEAREMILDDEPIPRDRPFAP